MSVEAYPTLPSSGFSCMCSPHPTLQVIGYFNQLAEGFDSHTDVAFFVRAESTMGAHSGQSICAPGLHSSLALGPDEVGQLKDWDP